MTRLQKKCLVFSLSLHVLLVGMLFAGAAFRSDPPESDLQLMTMIPANIVDAAGAGGGSPKVKMAAQPQSPQRAQPPPQAQTTRAERIEHQREQAPTPHEQIESSHAKPEPEAAKEKALTLESQTKPSKRPARHTVDVSYARAVVSTKGKKSDKIQTQTQTAESSARAEARRLKEIESALAELATGVQTSGSPSTIVEVTGGVGGGEAFASYRNAVFSAFYNAWIPPDDSSNPLACSEAKIVVARDGSIISAELVRHSDEASVDRSVEKALRMVSKLPPFPASTHDTTRTFNIRFRLDAKKLSE